jgi:hypothetical protein
MKNLIIALIATVVTFSVAANTTASTASSQAAVSAQSCTPVPPTTCAQERKKQAVKRAAKPAANKIDPFPGRIITVSQDGNIKAEAVPTPGTQVFLVDGPLEKKIPETKVTDLRTGVHSLATASQVVVPVPTVEQQKVATFWGWHDRNATAQAPKPCYADRAIVGKPTICSTVEVQPAFSGETETSWRNRMAKRAGYGETTSRSTNVQ